MNYMNLSDYCSYGWADRVRSILKESTEKCDLFWNDYHLFKKAAKQGGAAVMNVLIDYYNETELKGLDSDSDEYLHKMQPLVSAMQATYDSTFMTLPDVLTIFRQYIVFDDDKDTVSDLDDMPEPIFDDYNNENQEGDRVNDVDNFEGKLLGQIAIDSVN